MCAFQLLSSVVGCFFFLLLLEMSSPQLSKNQNLPPTILSSIFHSKHRPISLPLLSHELPLPYLHPSLTSHIPPTPPPCQLTPQHGHIALPFDPLRACRSTDAPRPAASELVCHRALSRSSVIDGSWCVALTHRAADFTWMVWWSIDYDATCDKEVEAGLSWWWQRETKDWGYGWGAVV